MGAEVEAEAAGRAASSPLQTLQSFQNFGIVGPWHTTVTAGLRAGDPMTGDPMTAGRDPTAIDLPTVPRIDRTGADRRTNPVRARRARRRMRAG